MHRKSDSDSMQLKLPRAGWVVSLLVVLVLILAACGGGATPEAAPAANTPATEAEAEATEAPAEEAEAESEAEAEATASATEEPAEEGEATAEATEEATEEAMEEATPEATEEPTEEPTEEATEEATEEPTEEPTEEATEEPTEEAAEEAAAEGEATPTPEPEEEEALSPEAEAGRYLVTISRGCGCHFNRNLGGYAGGTFNMRPGGEGTTLYPANITPHEETGIGSWTPEDVATAIRTGVTPDGGQLHPAMPYMAFSHLSDEDALNIAAYLFSLEPIENAVPARELPEDPAPYTPDPEPPATAPTDPVERGAYLARLARCGDCHTPRNEDGSPNMEMMLAGNRISDDEIAWNITPHEDTLVGQLSDEEIAEFLRTGALPDGSQVAGTMGDLIETYFSNLTEDDALAIAAFLKNLPPIENEPE